MKPSSEKVVQEARNHVEAQPTAATTLTSVNRRSMFWVAMETGGNAALLLAVMLIVARRVGAAEFALAALVVGTVQLLNLFVEGFFHDALIQNRDLHPSAFDKAFWATSSLAFAMLLAALAAAVVIDGEYDRAAWLFFASAAALPFSGALGILNAKLRRNFQFREVASASIAGRVGGGLLGLSMAYAGFGAWALVAQFTGGVVVNSCVLYATAKWRPQWQRDWRGLGPLVRFAFPYALMHSMSAARIQGFAGGVTAIMGLSAAGFLNVAFRLTTTPQTMLTVALLNFSFPSLSAAQGNQESIKRTFRLVTSIVSSSSLPIFAMIALTSQPLVSLLLGPDWLQIIPLIQILSIGAAISFLRLPGSFLLRSIGKVRYSFLNSGVQAGLTLGSLLLLRPGTTIGAALCWTLPALITLVATPLIVARAAEIPFADQCQALGPAIFAVMAMTVSVLALNWICSMRSHLAHLMVDTIVGFSVYAIVVLALGPEIRRLLFRPKSRFVPG